MPTHPRQLPVRASANQSQARLPWRAWEQQVAHLQKQIKQAAQQKDTRAVHTLQQRFLASESARMVAVRRAAAESQGKDTAGVDGVKSLTQQERLAMAARIHPHYWSEHPVLPVRRVWIPKPGTTERRPLAILPMIDRCKQVLVKLALEPEWEARFEAHSYGFRPGRGAHDAIAAIAVALERQPAFVLNADIARAFDEVSQTVILEKLQTFPALHTAIAGWLQAGIVDQGAYILSTRGIPQGGALSPLLLNVALHGMETVVTASATREQPLLVRYADNFVIVHPNLHVLQQTMKRIETWLAALGLRLNANKTTLTHTLTPVDGRVGFDFLGFHLYQHADKGAHEQKRKRSLTTIIVPSQEAGARHLATIDQRLHDLRTGSQAQVIAELNPLILGWTTYYHGVVDAASINGYDEAVEQRLLQWAGQRHPGQTRAWLLARYWQTTGKGQQVFATHDGIELRAYRPRWIR